MGPHVRLPKWNQNRQGKPKKKLRAIILPTIYGVPFYPHPVLLSTLGDYRGRKRRLLPRFCHIYSHVDNWLSQAIRHSGSHLSYCCQTIWLPKSEWEGICKPWRCRDQERNGNPQALSLLHEDTRASVRRNCFSADDRNLLYLHSVWLDHVILFQHRSSATQ